MPGRQLARRASPLRRVIESTHPRSISRGKQTQPDDRQPNEKDRLRRQSAPAPTWLEERNDTDDVDPWQSPPGLDVARWLHAYTAPYAGKRNVLLALVVVRSLQLAAMAWVVGYVVSGPIAGHSTSGLAAGVAGYLALAACTNICFHFRQRLALELGECVVHDLRNAVFAQLQRMNVSFFHRTRLGRIISRITSDIEAVRAGVQDVVFTSLVGLGQMLVAASLMLWYDPVLFAIIAAMGPVLGWLNYRFRGRLSRAHRAVQESFSRVTARLVEAVHGVQITQGFARQETNARMFRELVADHSVYNLEAARTAGIFVPLLELNSQAFLAAILIVGGYRVLSPGVGVAGRRADPVHVPGQHLLSADPNARRSIQPGHPRHGRRRACAAFWPPSPIGLILPRPARSRTSRAK